MITNEIAGHTLECYDKDHVYICDSIVVPSITQILKVKFGNKYNRVSGAVLLDGIISECEQVGIPTLTPAEIANIKFIGGTE